MMLHCGKPMAKGVALKKIVVSHPLAWRVGPHIIPLDKSDGKLMACWKCPACGHSILM